MQCRAGSARAWRGHVVGSTQWTEPTGRTAVSCWWRCLQRGTRTARLHSSAAPWTTHSLPVRAVLDWSAAPCELPRVGWTRQRAPTPSVAGWLSAHSPLLGSLRMANHSTSPSQCRCQRPKCVQQLPLFTCIRLCGKMQHPRRCGRCAASPCESALCASVESYASRAQVEPPAPSVPFPLRTSLCARIARRGMFSVLSESCAVWR